MCISFQVCYEKGIESVVIPKTSESSDSAWYGLAKYAWAGYVNLFFFQEIT